MVDVLTKAKQEVVQMDAVQAEALQVEVPQAEAVRVEALRIGYGKKKVAEGIHFSLPQGRILAVVGPNGSGKSTLLRTIAGFLPPMGGRIMLNQTLASDMSRAERARFLAVVMTDRPDVDWMRTWDVAASGRYPYTGKLGVLSDLDREIVEDALRRMEVLNLRERYFNELSDGQKQRILLAKSIAQRPKLLILDEPTSFLDLRYTLEFVRAARQLAKEDGMALLLSIHELSIARQLADLVVTLKNGVQDACASPEILTEEYIRNLYGIGDDVMLLRPWICS